MPSFWVLYDQLPVAIQNLADKNYELLKVNPRHPSLQLKKVGPYWSVRVGLKYRAVAVEVEDGLLWFWIGIHAEYDLQWDILFKKTQPQLIAAARRAKQEMAQGLTKPMDYNRL